VLLVEGRGEISVMPEVTTGLLHHSAIYIGTHYGVVSTGQRGNAGNACSNCNTVTSHCY